MLGNMNAIHCKTGFIATCLALLAILMFAQSCASAFIHPLKLSPTRANIVITPDNRIKVDGDYIKGSEFRQELVRRTINNNTPITLHVYWKTPEESFEAVYNKLIENEFTSLKIIEYKD